MRAAVGASYPLRQAAVYGRAGPIGRSATGRLRPSNYQPEPSSQCGDHCTIYQMSKSRVSLSGAHPLKINRKLPPLCSPPVGGSWPLGAPMCRVSRAGHMEIVKEGRSLDCEIDQVRPWRMSVDQPDPAPTSAWAEPCHSTPSAEPTLTFARLLSHSLAMTLALIESPTGKQAR
jgi:hypothetical protein